MTFAWHCQLTLTVFDDCLQQRRDINFYWKTVNFFLLSSLKLQKDLIHMDCCAVCDGVYVLAFHFILRYIHVYCIDTVLNLRTHSCVVYLSAN